jgi:polysaccharide export outer membrane protein
MSRKALSSLAGLGLLMLSACGIAYNASNVNPVMGSSGAKVRVVPITPESVMVANRSEYRPRQLPAAFYQSSGGTRRGAALAPEPVVDYSQRPEVLATRLPPEVPEISYTIGVGDVLLLATPQAGSTVEELTGLLEAANARQGYTVQDDGAIAIPNIGRVQVAGMTIEEAENRLFQRLVENQFDPTFSLEVAEFNSKKVSIGGAVGDPSVVPITLTPLYLDAALAAAGGITAEDQDYASIRIYRDGALYQIPLRELYSENRLSRIQLIDGDAVFVDTEYTLDRAQAYFEQQITLAEFTQSARMAALGELSAELNLQRSILSEQRQAFQTRLEMGAEKRDYVYLTGEIGTQSRYALPFDNTAALADALYSSGGVSSRTANMKGIYVLRGSPDPREFGAITAWQLNAADAANFVLSTRFELRPNDVIFVAEQPVTRWNRVISQITPSLITYAANIARE